MILDERTEFADAVSMINNAGTFVLGDVIDTGAAPTTKNLGPTDDLYVVIQIDTSVAAAAGAANVTFKVVSDADSALGSPTIHYVSDAIAKATLVAGYEIAVKLPHGSYERYLGVTYTIDTNPLTAGKGNAFLTPVYPKNTIYPDAI
jgi:hypothetical protein